MHKLYVSLTSPYARMARAVVIEKGLESVIEEVVVRPREDPGELIAANPAGLVPALARGDGGRPIFDSRLICAWLDHLPSERPALLAAGGPERLAARQAEALAQTIADKSAAMTLEKKRPAQNQYAPQLERWRAQTLRMAAAVAEELAHLPEKTSGDASLGSICLACALGHLDFRHPELDWRGANPQTAAWLDDFAQRDSLARTAPRE